VHPQGGQINNGIQLFPQGGSLVAGKHGNDHTGKEGSRDIFRSLYAAFSETGARRISDTLSEEGEPPNTGLRHDIFRLFERQGLGIFPQSVNVAKGRCKKGPGLFDFQTGGCGMVGGDGAFVGAVG
jgi:hypothetical protein